MVRVEDPRITIDNEIKVFDSENDTVVESTIRELINAYRGNQDCRQILVKVLTISTLYHARVLDIDLLPLSHHIESIDDLDSRMLHGDPAAVDAIWRSKGTKRHYPSFASKYCSWHNQEAYAIYDRNAWSALKAYATFGDRFAFPEREFTEYATFLNIVRRFQSSFGLQHYSLKDIDKFLWRVGGRLIAEKDSHSGASTTG